MTAFLHVWDDVKSHGVLVGVILIAVALVIAAATSRSLLGYWFGLRVGAPRDHVAEANHANAWRERDEAILRGELHAEAKRLMPDPPSIYGNRMSGPWTGVWPDDLCSAPACSPEDGGVCDHHQRLATPLAERVGKHRAVWSVPLDDQPNEVITAVVTQVQKRRQR